MENLMSLVLKQAARPRGVITAFDKPSTAEKHSEAVSVSVIIPVTERCNDLASLYQAYVEILNRTERSFEFLFVLDGGFEEAARKLEPIQASGEPIRVLSLPRAYGEATALMVGFEQARGDVFLTLPAHFQVTPEGVLEILNCLDEGHDLVVARRHPRVDSWVNRLQDYVFNFLTRWLTRTQFHDIGCRLKGMRRQVVQEIDLYGDLHRFLPLLAYQRGFRVSEVSVSQHPSDNRTKVYRPGVYLRRLLDIVTVVFLSRFAKKPLRFFGLIGAELFSVGFVITALLTVQRIFDLIALTDRPLLILGVLLMVLGVQIGSIGLLGEMIVFTHARKIKDYTIKQTLE